MIGKLFRICLLNKHCFQVLWGICANMLLRWYSFSEESWWIPDSLVMTVSVPETFKGQIKAVFKSTLKCYQALFITFSSICSFCSSHCNKNVDKSLYQTSFVLLFLLLFFKSLNLPLLWFWRLFLHFFRWWFVIWCSWSLFWSIETGCLRVQRVPRAS